MRRQLDIQRAAARQHGNVDRRQLHDAGWTERTIRSDVAAGWLIQRHRGVYAVGHVPRSQPSRWAAAVLALGPEAVLSHRACAAHFEIVRGAVPTEVIVPARLTRLRRDGIIVHRITLPPEHVTVRDGIPMTTLLRVLLDLATVFRVRALGNAFEEAQVRYGLQPEVVAAEVLCRRGHRGNARLAAILEGAVDPDKVRSILELRFLRMCAAHGIPRPIVNEKIGIWKPDFLWPEAELVVETDGGRFHRTAAKRRRDARKDAFLVSQGLTVLRLSWSDVTERTPETAGRVRAALVPSR